MSSRRLPVVLTLCLALALPAVPLSPAPASATGRAVVDPPGIDAGADARLQMAYGQLPRLFVENRGQTDPGVAFTLQGGAGSWERSAGGDLKGAWFTDASAGWVAGDVGLLHSTDGGQTWTVIPDADEHALSSVQFPDADNGWAAGANGVILHTADGGATWSQQASGVTRNLQNVIFVDDTWGWVNTGARPIRTTDGGLAWEPIVLPASESGGNVFFLDRQHGWLGASYGFYRTSDGGVTWTKTQNTPAFTTSMFFLDTLHGWTAGGFIDKGGRLGTVSRTTDGGDTWSWSGLSAVLNAIEFVSPLVGWTGSRLDGTWKSTNGGATWSNQGIGGTNDLSFLSANQGWAVGPGGGIWRTTDGGTAWATQSSRTVSGALEAVQFVAAGTGHAVGEDEAVWDGWMHDSDVYFLRTTDAGATWSRRSVRSLINPGGGTYYNHQLRALDFLDGNTGWIAGSYQYYDPYEWCTIAHQGTVAATTDGGGAWTPYRSVAPAVPRALDMVDGLNGWLAYGSQSCWREWTGEDFVCVCADRGGIRRTSDGGATWLEQLAVPGVPRAVAAIDSQSAFAAGDGGAIYRTTDAGTTWVPQTVPTVANLYDLFVLNATTGWAVGDSGTILHTVNGSDWQPQTSDSTANLRGTHFLDASRGWAAGEDGTILYTTDGGDHWLRQEVPTSLGLNGLHALSAADGWAVGESGIILRPGPVAPAVGVYVQGNDLALTWTHIVTNASYEVWRHTAPYFDPVYPPATLLASGLPPAGCTLVGQAITCSLPGAAGDPDANHFYLVRGIGTSGTRADSNRTGVFGFALSPGD